MTCLKIKKIVLYIGAFFLLTYTYTTQAAFLNSNAVQDINDSAQVVQEGAGYDPNLSLGQAVAFGIRAFLGLLGVIFIVLMLIAGFNWMTAAGDEEKIKKATSTIRAAIIGLLIIVAAYAITYFVFSNLPGTGSGGSFTGS